MGQRCVKDRLTVLRFSSPRMSLRHVAKTMRKFNIFSLLCDLEEPPTMPLPLQMTASIFLDNKSPAPSATGCLPPRLHSCRPVTSCWSWGTPGSDVSWGVGLSLSTVILMQLPAFLRAVTASWWVAPCTLRPLTWMGSRHTIDLWLVKVGAGVRGDGAA